VDAAVRPSLVIARYKDLWLQLSRLVRQTGVAVCYTYGFYVLYLFLMLTVSIYGVFSTLTVGPNLRLVYLVGDSLITATQLFVVCDGASSVSREVSNCLGTAAPNGPTVPAPDGRCVGSIDGKLTEVG
jgi:gustatory receptor